MSSSFHHFSSSKSKVSLKESKKGHLSPVAISSLSQSVQIAQWSEPSDATWYITGGISAISCSAALLCQTKSSVLGDSVSSPHHVISLGAICRKNICLAAQHSSIEEWVEQAQPREDQEGE